MKNSFYSEEELKQIGFNSLGDNTLISKFVRFYNPEKIAVGNNVRIDDFCVLSCGTTGAIAIGDYVHIAVYSSLIGAGKITLSDFSGLSSRVSIYSSNDDYSGTAMTNPTIPSQFTGVTTADVFLGKHVIVGSGSVILPGIRLEDGVAIGALSLVNKDCKAFGIYGGNPAKYIKERKCDLLVVESNLTSYLNESK